MLMFAEKYESFEMNQTPLIPTPIYRVPDFEERLREQIDVDQLIDADNKALKDFANQRIAIPARDLNRKDMDLI